MIAKEPYVAALKEILKRQAARDKLHKPLAELGIDISSDPLEDAMVTLMDAALNMPDMPTGGFTSWWLYDCSMSRGKGIPTKLRLDDRELTAGTPEELYDMAVAYSKYTEEM